MSQGLVMFTKNADVSGPEPAYYLLLARIPQPSLEETYGESICLE